MEGAPMKTDTTQSDLDALTGLNRDYIHSVQHGDVQRFEEILADDFLCSNPDGSLVDKNQFLAQTARPVTISGLSAQGVRARILGHVAIIHARTSYTTADGEQRNGRYTDVWARRDGRWLAVSAHVTRSPCPKPTSAGRCLGNFMASGGSGAAIGVHRTDTSILKA